MMDKESKKPSKEDKPLNNNDIKKILSRKNVYKLPPNIISLLNEHTCGFVLMALDHNGNANFYCKHDNPTVGKAVESELLNILSIRQGLAEEQLLRDMGIIPNDDDI